MLLVGQQSVNFCLIQLGLCIGWCVRSLHKQDYQSMCQYGLLLLALYAEVDARLPAHQQDQPLHVCMDM